VRLSFGSVGVGKTKPASPRISVQDGAGGWKQRCTCAQEGDRFVKGGDHGAGEVKSTVKISPPTHGRSLFFAFQASEDVHPKLDS
jgi:hypothetical protein